MPSCAICGFEAPSENHLRVHIENKHDDRVLTYDKCEKTCIGGRKLKTHMESHKEVTCKHCEERIPHNSRSSHVTKCVGDKKAHKCERCPAVFTTAGNVKEHMDKNRCTIQCNICDKTLKSEAYLEKTHRVNSTQLN